METEEKGEAHDALLSKLRRLTNLLANATKVLTNATKVVIALTALLIALAALYCWCREVPHPGTATPYCVFYRGQQETDREKGTSQSGCNERMRALGATGDSLHCVTDGMKNWSDGDHNVSDHPFGAPCYWKP
jgi:hypothetical protein